MQEDKSQGQPGQVISPQGGGTVPSTPPQDVATSEVTNTPLPSPSSGPQDAPAPETVTTPAQQTSQPVTEPVIPTSTPVQNPVGLNNKPVSPSEAYVPQPELSQQVEEPLAPPLSQPDDSSFYVPTQDRAPTQNTGGVSWSASEYVANQKNANWYILLGILTVVVCVVIYLVTHDTISTIAIGLLGVILGIFAARKPHILEYHIDGRGIQIGTKYYPYASFKAFSIAEEHAMSYISLLPLKRFMVPIVIHYAPNDEENIINTLADYLPYEDHKLDMVDSISRRARF